MRIEVESGDLLEGIKAVEHALPKGRDAVTRPILNTIRVEAREKGIRLVTADNYRISMVEIEAKIEGLEDEVLATSLLSQWIPILRPWIRLGMGVLSIEVYPERLVFGRTDHPGVLEIPVFQGAYPKYETVIPSTEGMVPVSLNARFLRDLEKVKGGSGIVRIWIRPRKDLPIEGEAEVFLDSVDPVLVESVGGGIKEVLMPARTADLGRGKK